MESMAVQIYENLTTNETKQNVNFKVKELNAITGDSSMIRQVWINLISNAIKFTSKIPEPTIEIFSQLEKESVVYSIKDNGVGFDMKYVDKLFGVFQRLHSSREYEGTGVGLAIVNRIITRHGGRVWAESGEGCGATFYFSLPTTKKHKNS